MAEGDTAEKGAAAVQTEPSRFKISITKDRMEVRMYPLIGIHEGGLVTYEDVVEAFKKENIKAEIDEALVRSQLVEVNPQETTIAKGKRPHDGRDGHIEYKFDMSAKPQFVADPKDSSAIDYKNSMQVTLVHAGDILATIIPPGPGEPGEDVNGLPIEAKPGAKAKYFVGEGLEEKEGDIIVTASGTPSVQDDLLMVRRSYVLQGDVGLSSGNITFPGTVVIHGNVTDGFEVTSDENVVINGLITGAKVKAKGYIKCSGGIQGKDRTEIIAGGFVAATFINAAVVVAEGDVLVTKDILHSTISCLGELRTGGSIIGGVTSVFKGAECGGDVGSETGVKTIVNIRTHYRQEKAKEQANAIATETNAIFDRYKTWSKQDILKEEDTAKLAKDITSLQALIAKRQMCDNQVTKFNQMVFENKTAKIKILGTLESDVVIASPYTRYTSTAHMKGPLAVSENNEFQKMAIMRGGTVYGGDPGENQHP
ncbi:MAG: FapA family protein [Fibromonadales bacterium]|nr:FapA family protein [Fibromonadales bacterium]